MYLEVSSTRVDLCVTEFVMTETQADVLNLITEGILLNFLDHHFNK